MELKFVFVLGFVSLVSTTPHGHGANSGAVAKATAVAGAFAAAPDISALGGAHGLDLGSSGSSAIDAGMGIPSTKGGSYSGSFSKSSASSFASSSSSASSYSFSGSNGFAAPGVDLVKNINPAINTAPGSVGQKVSNEDSSGILASQPSKSISGSNSNINSAAFSGADSTGYSGASNNNPEVYPPLTDTPNKEKCGSSDGCANGFDSPKPVPLPSNINFGGSINSAQATAGANVANQFASKPGCTGSSCNVSPSKNTCTSGNCQPQSQTSSNSGNDITVNTGLYSGTKTSYDADQQSHLNDKNTSGNKGSNQPNCATGFCNITPTGANVKFNNQPHPTKQPQPQYNVPCNSPSCGGNSKPVADFRPSNSVPPPTYLVVPKETYPYNNGCTSGNCGNLPFTNIIPSNNQNHEGSFNHNTNSLGDKLPCNTPYCDTQGSSSGSTSNSNSASHSAGAIYPSNTNFNQQGTQCTGPSCSYPQLNKPNYSSGPLPTGKIPINQAPPGIVPTNCASGSCGNYPHASAGAGANIPSGVYNKPIYESAKPITSRPIYSGGFGGPPGLLKPSDYSSPPKPVFSNQQKPTGIPNYPPSTVSVSNTPTQVSSQTEDEDQQSYFPLNNKQPANHNHGHSQGGSIAGAAAGANAIAYTGGFGGPPGFLKPYDNGEKIGSFNQKYDKIGAAPSSNYNVPSGTPSGAAPTSNYNVPSGTPSGAAPSSNYIVPSGTPSGAAPSSNYNIPSGTPIGAAPSSNYNVPSGTPSGAAPSSNYNFPSGTPSGAFTGPGALGSGSNGYYVNNPHHYHTAGEGGVQSPGGCRVCQSLGGGYVNEGGIGLSGLLRLGKSGSLDGLAGDGLQLVKSGANSIAGSVAGAGAGSFGINGAFAGSAATAHASSGAATKGGYGGR